MTGGGSFEELGRVVARAPGVAAAVAGMAAVAGAVGAVVALAAGVVTAGVAGGAVAPEDGVCAMVSPGGVSGASAGPASVGASVETGASAELVPVADEVVVVGATAGVGA